MHKQGQTEDGDLTFEVLPSLKQVETLVIVDFTMDRVSSVSFNNRLIYVTSNLCLYLNIE